MSVEAGTVTDVAAVLPTTVSAEVDDAAPELEVPLLAALADWTADFIAERVRRSRW